MRPDALLAIALLLLAGAAAGRQAVDGSARVDALPAEARARLQARAVEWDALPRAERQRRRDNHAAWQALAPADRDRLRRAAGAFAALRVEEQQALRARFDALDERERRGWLLGPELGADYPRLHALLGQVPEHEREPLLAALRAMTAAERDDLAVLAQRTPPQAREELRIALLATPANRRGQWLRRQVDP